MKEKELSLYRHDDFWYCMDTPRDLQFLNALWDAGKSPWMKGKAGGKSGDWKAVLDRI